MAALTKNPAAISANEVITRPSTGPAASAWPTCAMLSAPVRPYRRAMPNRMRIAPMLFDSAKVSAPCSGADSSLRYAVSAYAATLISSKNTNMLNRSPVRQNPTIAPRKASMSAWKIGPTASK
jgi:hypothetical protein